jgi:hypothetical protein
MNRYQHSGLLFMETEIKDITMDMYVVRARKLLEEGHKGENKVYKEVRKFLQQYADSQNKLCHITVPYWVHKCSPHTLASLLKLWCEIVDDGKARA